MTEAAQVVAPQLEGMTELSGALGKVMGDSRFAAMSRDEKRAALVSAINGARAGRTTEGAQTVSDPANSVEALFGIKTPPVRPSRFRAAPASASIAPVEVQPAVAEVAPSVQQEAPQVARQPAKATEVQASSADVALFSDSQRQTAAENLRRHWLGDRMALEKALAANGIAANVTQPELATKPASSLPKVASYTPSEEEAQFDAALGGAAPEAYEINWHGRIPEPLQLEDLPRFNADVRNVLSAMALPARIGGAIAEMTFDDAKTYLSLDDTGKRLYDLEQVAALRRIVPDVAEANSNARALLSLARDQHLEVMQEMLDHGAFRSARVIAHLHQQAERMFERARMSERRMKAQLQGAK